MNNIGPALTAQGFNNVAQTQLQGSQALASGVSSAGKSLAGGLGDALEAMHERAGLQAANASTAQAWKDSGVLDRNPKLAGVFERAAAEKDPYRQRGLMTVGDALVRMESEKDRVRNQMDQARQLALDKATISAQAPGRVLKTANGFYQQVNGGWQPALDPQGNPLVAPATGGNGILEAMQGLGGQSDLTEIKRIQDEIAAGNEKPGPDFLADGVWFGQKPFKQQLAEKVAAVAGAGGAPATGQIPAGGAPAGGAPATGLPAGAAQNGAVQAWNSPAQVGAALQSGQLTREAARQILQSHFGFR